MKNNYLILFVATMLVYLLTGFTSVSGQAYPNIGLGWNTEMGCSIYDSEGHALMEELEDLPCLQICEGAEVQYWVTGLPTGASVEWTVIGGTYISQPGNGILVTWSSNHRKSVVYIEVTLDDGTILEFQVCVEMVGNPIAGFTLPPPGEEPVFCVGQEIFFTNTSTPNYGGQLVDFHWNFGEEEGLTTSNEFEPSHIYTQPGTYIITLTVWNECRCSDTYQLEVIIEDMGEPVEIECPTVTCEDSIEMYSANILDCEEAQYTWVVEGGTILNNTEHHPIVEVLWDNVNNTGFGWVTLYLEGCDVCPVPSTVKIPVVKNEGFIMPGNEEEPDTLCKGSQYRFYLPQWPTTEIEWSLMDTGGTDYSYLLTASDQRNEIIVNLLPPAASSLPPGDYILRASYFNTLKGCTGFAEKELRILEAPHTITGPSKACEGELLVFQTVVPNSQTNWILENSSGFVQFHNGMSFSTSLAPGMYVLTANSPNRCTGEGFIFHVYAYPPTPMGDFTLPEEVCPGVTYTVGFTNTDPNFNPYLYNMTWEVANGEVIGNNIGQQVDVIFDENPSGAYTVSVGYTRKTEPLCPSNLLVSGVIDPISINTVIEPYDVSSGITIPTNKFCTSTETHFRVDETEGDEYIWTVTPSNFGSVVQGQGTNEVVIMWNEIANNQTLGDVEVEIRKCMEWFTVPVYVAELIESPEITLDFPLQVCDETGFDVLVTIDVPLLTHSGIEMTLFDGGTPHTNFTTPSSTEILFTGVQYPPVHTGSVLHTITVTIFGPNGCLVPSIATGQITVIPSPIAGIVPNLSTTTFCTQTDLDLANLQLTAIDQNGLVQITNWQWWYSSSSAAGPYTQLGNTAVQAAQNFGWYKVEGIGANGCSTMSDPIKVNQDCSSGGGPDPGDPCPDETLSISTAWISCNTIQATANTTNPPQSYSWQASPSSRISLISMTGNTALFEVNGPGSYNIRGFATYSCGIITNSTQQIILYQPLMHYGVECLPNGDYAVTLYNDSPFVAGNDPDHTIFFHNGTPVNYPNINQDEHTFVVSPGTHDFQLEIRKAGHPDCLSPILTLDLTPPDASFTIPSFACAGDGGYGDVLTLIPDNPDPNSTYRWEFSETANLNMETPVVLFTQYGTPFQDITLTVTDRFGCTATSTLPIDIFLPDFDGEILGHENPVCEGDTMTLYYYTDVGQTPSTYQWLLDENEVPGATGPTFNAGVKGLYSVLVSDANGCLQLIGPVNVHIIPNPTVSITGPELACAGQAFTLNGSSNQSGYARLWRRNGVAITAFNSSTPWSITRTENNPGIYTYTLQVGNPALGECTHTEVFTIEVMPEPDPQHAQMVFRVYCNPFEVQAYISNPDPNGTYNWSNGDFGTQTIVNHSGLIGVHYTNEWGCSIWTSEIIPKLPEEHLWVFPTGCAEVCEREPDTYVIGPLPIYDSYEWVWNAIPGNPQYNTVVQPEYIQTDGTLQLYLGTDILGTYCELTTDVLNISYAHEGCRPCEPDEVQLYVEEEIRIIFDPFLHYDVPLIMVNNHGMTLTFQLSSPDGMFVPSTFTVNPGQTFANTQFFPNAGFTGGPTTVIVKVLYNGTFFCEFEIEMEFSHAFQARINETDPMKLSLIPNPAEYGVLVSYDLQDSKNGTLILYSLTGVALLEQPVFDNKGTVSLNLTSLSSGTYIVVLRDDAGQRKQQILIKK